MQLPENHKDISVLSSTGLATAVSQVARPPSRFLTRLAVPVIIVLMTLALVVYAARESFRPALSVSVVPVVLRRGGDSTDAAAPGEIVQAPGWIEADPSAVGVPALASGVLKELLVLDGERVEAGQVVAVMIDEDAKLAVNNAQAQVTRATAMIAEARAAVAVAEALVAEARESLDRVQNLTGTGAVPEGDIVSRRLKVASQIAAADTARAAVARAEADEEAARVGLKQAELDLSRMSVRSPAAGVVLQRLVEPGQRLMPDANNPFAGVVVRLYDPAHIQMRVDVPLSDAAKVRIGDSVEMSTETLPGRTFNGTLTRFVHEANLQKNTVQVKVSITDPAPELKPDMLAKARIATRSAEPTGASAPLNEGAVEDVLVIPRDAIVDLSGTQAAAWVLDRETATGVKRVIRLGRITAESADVLEGLRPGDRVILNPPIDLRPGVKIQAAGEREIP